MHVQSARGHVCRETPSTGVLSFLGACGLAVLREEREGWMEEEGKKRPLNGGRAKRRRPLQHSSNRTPTPHPPPTSVGGRGGWRGNRGQRDDDLMGRTPCLLINSRAAVHTGAACCRPRVVSIFGHQCRSSQPCCTAAHGRLTPGSAPGSGP